MATIDLGKVAFTHKGTYSSSTTYEEKDCVQYTDGDITSTFVYVNSTSASGQTPSTGGTVNTTYWSLMAKGQPQTFNANDLSNDISTLALRQSTNENKGAYNTNSMYVDVFQDATGYTNGANTTRNDLEYVSSVTETITNNVSVGYGGNTYSDYFGTYAQNSATQGLKLENKGGSFTSGDTLTAWNSISEHTSMGTGAYTDAWAAHFGNGSMQNGTYSHQFTGTNNYLFRYKLKDSYAGIQITGVEMEWANGSSNNDYGAFITVDSSNVVTERWTIWSGTPSNGNLYSKTDFSGLPYVGELGFRIRYTGTNSGGFERTKFIGNIKELTTSATGNFTCPAITAPSTITKMGAIITYEDTSGTNALNTDIVLQVSADNGSNYTTATLTAMPDFSTGTKMAKVNDVTVTGGTQLKYKISFANQASGSKEARIRGVSLMY